LARSPEVGERLESARKRADELAASGAFEAAIERALMYSRLDQQTLELGVDLDEDPQVTSWGLESLTVEAAAELPGTELLIDATAEASVLVDLMIFRADYYPAEEGRGRLIHRRGTQHRGVLRRGRERRRHRARTVDYNRP
jgi:hypothetical protein